MSIKLEREGLKMSGNKLKDLLTENKGLINKINAANKTKVIKTNNKTFAEILQEKENEKLSYFKDLQKNVEAAYNLLINNKVTIEDKLNWSMHLQNVKDLCIDERQKDFEQDLDAKLAKLGSSKFTESTHGNGDLSDDDSADDSDDNITSPSKFHN